MLKKILLPLFFLPVLAFSASGEELVTRFWNNIAAQDYTHAAGSVSNHFTSTAQTEYYLSDESVTLNKTQFMSYLQGLGITGYTITNLQSVKNVHNYVVTYDITLNLPIKGRNSNQFHEVYIYERKDDHWKLISASFFPFYNVG